MVDDVQKHWTDFVQYNKTQSFDILQQEKSKYVKKIVGEDLLNKRLNVLSIGPADGQLDELVLRKSGIKLASYHAIEPSDEFQIGLKKRIQTWNTPFIIEQKSFSEDYQLQGEVKYDLILMASVLYYMKNMGLAVQHARSLLEPTSGKLVVVHQTDNCGNKLYKCHLKAFPEIKNTTFAYQTSHRDVLQELDALKIPYKCYIVEESQTTGVDADDFVRCIMGNVRVPRHPFVDFMVQCHVDELPDWLQKQLYDIVLKHSVINDEGRYIISDGFAAIQINGKQ